jgi:hypothetical protein
LVEVMAIASIINAFGDGDATFLTPRSSITKKYDNN